MGLYEPTDQSGQPLNVIYAEDIKQFVDLLSGNRDGGALSLLAPLSSPLVPTVSLSSGSITGTGYQWGVYWITGFMDGTDTAHVTGRTLYGVLTGAQSLTSKQATISISTLSPPTGAIGWGVARNKSAGGTWYTVPGSEQFLSAAGAMPASFVDNVADASLVTLAPTANTTGTTFAGVPGAQLDYAQITTGVTVSSTSETAPTLIVSGNSVIYSGVPVIIEFFSESISVPNGAASQVSVCTLNVWMDSTNLGRVLACSQQPGAGGQSFPCYAKMKYTPTAGAHTFKIQAFDFNGGGGNSGVAAGSGGSGSALPAWIRVTQA